MYDETAQSKLKLQYENQHFSNNFTNNIFAMHFVISSD